ncbi:beta-1,3-galactosyltransferase GALT1 [Cryptomeria japonica]|uniref:beta-1,3-galactosyltransferase GALT1 n=1 Tax=Cryptomeria japonica TaxID=3369 RepID=UPI0027DA5547|nr:beta-1,3-galactosyltransferase GALT1 [Cryptomeria japonica]XP_057828011.2 beta-1,3-galactosyltransferase GALT1 [Cryptomeria japonica]
MVSMLTMKKWSGGTLIIFLVVILVLRYSILESSPPKQSPFNFFRNLNPLHVEQNEIIQPSQSPDNIDQVIKFPAIPGEDFQHLLSWKNLTEEELQSLQTWNHFKHVINHTELLPQTFDAVKEAVVAWKDLLDSINQEKVFIAKDGSSFKNHTKEQCPYSLSVINQTEFKSDRFKLQIPCGLVQDSSITVVGIPDGLLGSFYIELIGSQLPEEPNPPIVLHYNVRLQGDKITENPVIVQNTWTIGHEWGEEERCPLPVPGERQKVDDLDKCSERVGKPANRKYVNGNHTGIDKQLSIIRKGAKQRIYFPFTERYPFAATIWVGQDGFHMTVNGKHITSFEYRESLEPWLVSGVRFAGDLQLLSVLASGLPMSEDHDNVFDLDSLKARPFAPQEKLTLLIGVFSTGNNFNRRMAIRRSWMQYDAIKSGVVAVRFFVGMDKNKRVNEELWKEARTYGDIQLVPFVDYYNLITLKTIAICTYGIKVVSAQYIMKTDDDTFVRVDAVLSAVTNTGTKKGLLYGLMSFESHPHRSQDSKWYISREEYSQDSYPPWAHGPGYIISKDIAEFVIRGHQEKHLKLFKLEDVAMGIWIEEYKKSGQDIHYINDDKFFNMGCERDYIIAHYQGPAKMICLWRKLRQGSGPVCCNL